MTDRAKLVFYSAKVREAIGILVSHPSHLKNRLTKAAPLIMLINNDELVNDSDLDRLVSSLQTRLGSNFPEQGVSIGRKHTKTLIPIAEDIWTLYFLLEQQLDGAQEGE